MPFTIDQVREAASSIGLDFETAAFTLEDLAAGMEVELEHGTRDPRTDVTGDDPVMTAKIAWAHLLELSDYYVRLAQVEGGEHARTSTFEAQVDHLGRQVEELTTFVARSQLDQWQSRIDDLELQIALARMTLREEAAPRIDELRSRLEKARGELATVGERAGSAWGSLSAGLRSAIGELKDAFEETRELIRS